MEFSVWTLFCLYSSITVLPRHRWRALQPPFKESSFFPSAVQGRPQISAEKMCLVALMYIGSQVSMYSVAGKFDMTESSEHAYIHRVVQFLHAISDEAISWPSNAQMVRIKAGFLAKSGGKGPHNTIGCIDESHVEILKPSESAQSFYNWKKWASIILQGICNDQNKLLDMFICFPVFAHDARVMRESLFFASAVAMCNRGYFLVDCAYPLMPWLMTPYRDNANNFPSWKNFNRWHSQQRVPTENMFGLLKQGFRRLYLVDAKSVSQCCYIVMAACVLHNLCNKERDFLHELASSPEEDVGNKESEGNVDCSLSSYSESLQKLIAKEQC